VLDHHALLFDRVAHAVQLKGQSYFSLLAVVQHAKGNLTQRHGDLVLEHAAVQFAHKLGHIGQTFITHRVYPLKVGC